MSNTKELSLHLKEDRIYYPGDSIKGYLIVNPKKTIDVQHILLKFHGYVETYSGDKLVTWNEEKHLVTPPKAKKYTTISSGQVHEYDFEFRIPADRRLPSHANIPKIANVAYFLTAIHKRPRLKFTHSLSPVSEEIKILEKIDVQTSEYMSPVNMSSELGFINGSKLSFWNLHLPKSGFIRGDVINLECNIFNFPAMNKPKAVKFSFIRLIHKTNSGKLLDKKTLSFKALDLVIDPTASTTCSQQVAIIELNVPSNTPPSIFPDSGRRLSISYVVQAELVMKGVKTAIKLKPVYVQEVSIVIGTYPTANALTNHFDAVDSSIVHCDSTIGYGTYNSPFHTLSFNNDTFDFSRTLSTELCRRKSAGHDPKNGCSPVTASSVGVRKQRSQQNYYTALAAIAAAPDFITPLPRLSKTTSTINKSNNDANNPKEKSSAPNPTANGRLTCVSPLKDSSTTTASSFSSFTLPMTPVSTYHLDMNDYLPSLTTTANVATISHATTKKNTVEGYGNSAPLASSQLQQSIAPLETSISTASYSDRSLTPLPALTKRRSSSPYIQQRRGFKNHHSLAATMSAVNNKRKEEKDGDGLRLFSDQFSGKQRQRLSKASPAAVILSSPNEIGPNDVIVSGGVKQSSATTSVVKSKRSEDANFPTTMRRQQQHTIEAPIAAMSVWDRDKTLDLRESTRQIQRIEDEEAFCKDDTHSMDNARTHVMYADCK